MVQERNGKMAALALTLLCFVLCFVPVPAASVGIAAGVPLLPRLTYSFFHVGFLHCSLNCWALLCLVFYYRASLTKIVVAYLIAVSFPADTLGSPLTVGLSGVCFALMGLVAWRVRRKLYWQTWMGAFIAVGFLLPNVNAPLHLYCYVVGCLVGLLDMPIKRKSK